MNIKIIDKVGLNSHVLIRLAEYAMSEKPLKSGVTSEGISFGMFELPLIKIPFPLWITIERKRPSEKSPITVTIKKLETI